MCLLSDTFAQFSQFEEFNTARFSRVIGMGNAFTGLADDIETVYFNPAGLAGLDYYAAIYSMGHGFAVITNDYTADDLAVIIPAFNKLGIFALSVDRFKLTPDAVPESTYRECLYRLHFSRFLFTNFSVGTSLNFYCFYNYNSSPKIMDESTSNEISGNAFDLSISALYILPAISFPGFVNETRFGFQMQNIIDSDMHYSENLESNSKHQTLRAGLSTGFVPNIQKQFNLIPIKFIIAADGVFYGSAYKFSLFQPNFGIELVLFEILKGRYGRENELVIGDAYEYSPQHPVKRYGLGITIPLHKFIKGFEKLELSVDYSYSDWDQIDESKSFFPYFYNDLPVRDSFSIKLSFQN
jgi:hypothetical protein